MRALKHPALGLALLIMGVAQLPSQLSSVVQMVVLDRGGDMPWSLVLPMLLTAVTTALQVATGWAVMTRRYAGVLFACYVASCVALTVVISTLARGEEPLSASILLAAAVETLGMPVLIAIASLMYSEAELEPTQSFADVSAALLMIALHAFVMSPIQVMQFVRMTRGAETTIGGWFNMLLFPTIWVALGIVAALGSRNKKSAQVYVIVSIAVSLILAVLTIAWTMFEDDEAMMRKFLVTTRIVGLVSLASPLAFWWYTQAASDARGGSRVPLWIALTYVPTLVARLCLTSDIAEQVGTHATGFVVVLSLAFAFVLLALGDRGLRRSGAARVWAAIAAVIALAITIAGTVYVVGRERRTEYFGLLAPLGNLVASTVIVAWRGAA